MNEPHDEPAFPIHGAPAENYCQGMTKLEYFSGLAMQGIISNPTLTLDGETKLHEDNVAKASVQFATALLDELDKRKVKNE